MNVYVMLNYVMHEIMCPQYYLPIILINLRPLNMVCETVNSLTMLIKEPRINIDLISSVFRFYFPTPPEDTTYHGQVRSQYVIVYHLDEPWESTDEHPCILFFEGMTLVEILVYIPFQNQRFLKQIQYYFHPKRKGSCLVCLEDDVVLVNLHQNQYHHEVCSNCIFKVDQCPLCRHPVPQYSQ